MLLANIVVAKFISEKNVPTLYRIHEDPFADALKNLELIAHNWGVKARLSAQGRSGETQKNLMKMLAAVKGKPEEIILSILTLRSMKQAQYHQENKGHFGLAFDHYTHFTSPIRRYPDLIVHRTLKQILKGDKLRETEKDELFEKMTQMGIHLSGCEQRATQAERDLMSVKRCRFMEKRLGQVFAGLVTGIHKFGFFVQLREYDIDGLVSVQSLDFDYFTYNEAAQKLIGKKTKTVVSLGDVVEVKVVRADYNKRQIDFEWVNHKNANANPEKRSQTPPDRQRHGQARLSQPHGKSHPGKVHSKKNNKRRGRRKAKRG
jgi:ribonuclease R